MLSAKWRPCCLSLNVLTKLFQPLSLRIYFQKHKVIYLNAEIIKIFICERQELTYMA